MCSLQNEGLFDILVMKTASYICHEKGKFPWKMLQSRGQWEKGANWQDAISDGNMGNHPTLHPLSPLENLEANCSAFPQHFPKKLLLYFLLV